MSIETYISREYMIMDLIASGFFSSHLRIALVLYDFAICWCVLCACVDAGCVHPTYAEAGCAHYVCIFLLLHSSQ